MTETYKEYVAKRVHRFRKLSGLSQADFAKKAKIPLHDYLRIENGEVDLGPARFVRLREAAGIVLLEEEDYRPSVREVRELFGTATDPDKENFLQPLLNTEQDAIADGMYWVDFLKEFFPEMADIFFRMIESARNEINLSRMDV
jgi:transcriptional regulator with XRE-family HTH domain